MLARAESWLSPLERARRVTLSAVARVSPRLVAAREPRVALLASALVVVAFVATALAPVWLLLLGPILLGVPHVVADVRYLVTRPRLHARWPLWILVGAPLATCFFGGGVRAGLVATCGALLVARGAPLLRALAIAITASLFALATCAGPVADLAFAHLHNFVAIALWWAWRRRTRHLHALPLALFAVACALLVGGVVSPSLAALPPDIADGLAPHDLVPIELTSLGGRLVALFAFAQAMHYSTWLRLVPEEDRLRKTPRTFASSLRALAADVGPWVLGAAALATVGFGVYALFDLVAAREAYLSAAIFHGHLELAAGALLLVERRLPLGAPVDARWSSSRLARGPRANVRSILATSPKSRSPARGSFP